MIYDTPYMINMMSGIWFMMPCMKLCVIVYVMYRRTSQSMYHTLHIIYHTSHTTYQHLIPHITHHISHITHHISYIIHHKSYRGSE